MNIPAPDGKRIVVVGGGFAGVSLCRGLSGCGAQVVVIDSNNYHQFQPLLYQVATAGLEPTAIAFPLRKFLRSSRNFYFRRATVSGVDTVNKTITTDQGSVSYDFLVLAAGTDTNYFGMQNIQRAALPLKSVGEALALRNRLLEVMELAACQEDPVERARLMTIVIVGGGPTGVELAGAVAELKRHIFGKDYPELDMAQMKIYLLNASPRLLESFSEQSSQTALVELQKMGVEVLLSAAVKDFADGKVIYNDGQTIDCELVVWVSGVIANEFSGVGSTSRGRRIVVDQYNKVVGAEDVFAIGDISFMACDGYPSGHPQVAQVAIQQGSTLAGNLKHILQNKGDRRPFKYYDKGSMATIGRAKAVTEIKGIKIKGFIAWVAWLALHLLYVVGAHNRFTVLTDWFWGLIIYDRPFRTIIRK